MEAKRGRRRKARGLRDAQAPRQPLTGYVRYLNERREALRAANPLLGFAEVTRRLAGEWSRLQADDKRQYLDAAEQDRERYVKEWAAYKETDAYRAFRLRQLDKKASDPKRKNQTDPEPGAQPLSTSQPAAAAETPVDAKESDNRPKTVELPISRTDAARRPEADVPIFTEQFLQHNKLRETELRQLRKANADYEQQNAILQKHIENMKGVVERTKTETAERASRAAALRTHLAYLVGRLTSTFNSVPLPGGPTGATEQNIEQYMEHLHSLSVENKNDTVVKQAREMLSKMDTVA